MISTVKREIAIEKELLSKIEWACTFSNCEPKIKNGNLRVGSLAEGISNTKLHLIFDTRIINLRLLFLRDITNKLFISHQLQ